MTPRLRCPGRSPHGFARRLRCHRSSSGDSLGRSQLPSPPGRCDRRFRFEARRSRHSQIGTDCALQKVSTLVLALSAPCRRSAPRCRRSLRPAEGLHLDAGALCALQKVCTSMQALSEPCRRSAPRCRRSLRPAGRSAPRCRRSLRPAGRSAPRCRRSLRLAGKVCTSVQVVSAPCREGLHLDAGAHCALQRGLQLDAGAHCALQKVCTLCSRSLRSSQVPRAASCAASGREQARALRRRLDSATATGHGDRLRPRPPTTATGYGHRLRPPATATPMPWPAPRSDRRSAQLGTLAQSAMNLSRPLVVSGWLNIWSSTDRGMVATWAPISADSTTCCGWRTEATSTCVSNS